MGVVVAARDELLGRDVAIKMLLPAFAAEPSMRQRFVREGRAAAGLKHPNIVAVYDAGQERGGCAYLVQELLVGRSLQDELDTRMECDSPASAVEIMLVLLDALATAHEAGFIHRDVKAANVFLEVRDGTRRIVLVDFGLVKDLKNISGLRLTQKAGPLGTAECMSPEQINQADDIDAGTDVWSAGVLLFELLVGRRPFTGATWIALAFAICTSELPDAREESPWVIPDDLHRVLVKALDRDRSKRYRNAREFRNALLAVDRQGLENQRGPRRPSTKEEDARGKEVAARLVRRDG